MLLLILQLLLGGIIVGLFLLFIDKVQTEHRKKLSKSVTLKDPPEPRFGPYLKMIVGVLTVLFLLTVLIALPYHWRHHIGNGNFPGTDSVATVGNDSSLVGSINSSNARQTRQIIEAFSNTSVTRITNASANTFIYGFSLALKIFTALCVIAAILAVSLRGKIIASALALFSLAIDIGFEIKFGFDPEFKIDFTIGKPCDSIPKPYTDTTAIVTISPFVAGYDTLPSAVKEINISKLRDSFSNRQMLSVHIYGGVDPRPVKRKAREKFGDNLSLSQARANWVMTRLLEFNPEWKTSGVKIYTQPGGAIFYSDTTYSEKDYESNRQVTVYGVYKKEPLKQ